MKVPSYKPGWNEPCLCGSSKKYKDCCRSRLLGFDIGKKYLEAIADKNLERAILACRADITQYTIWHKSHTERALRANPDLGILRIDVNALAAYVERLAWLYHHTGRSANWLDVLERIQKNINHVKWRRKIAYFRSVHFLAPPQRREEARRELRRAGSITPEETDIELLQIYVDLELNDAPFSRKMVYFDRIIAISKSVSDQLQYRSAKAIQYFLIGDRSAAEETITDALSIARLAENQPWSDYVKNMVAKALQFSGMLKENGDIIRESIATYNDLILADTWTSEGKSFFYSEIGTCYKFLEEWGGVEEFHRKALELNENSRDRIHLSESLVYQKKIDLAVAEIDKIDRGTLEGTVYEDYVLTFAIVAIWSEDITKLEDAKSLLEKHKETEPYFNERRLKLRLSIANILLSGKVSAKAKAESTAGRNFLAVASSIIMLQPNIAGIGINLNAMIDYFTKKAPPKTGE